MIALWKPTKENVPDRKEQSLVANAADRSTRGLGTLAFRE